MERRNNSQDSYSSEDDAYEESYSSFSSSFSPVQPIQVSQHIQSTAIVYGSLGGTNPFIQHHQAVGGAVPTQPSLQDPGFYQRVSWQPFTANAEPADDYPQPMQMSCQETAQGARGPSQLVVAPLSRLQNYQNQIIPSQRRTTEPPNHTEKNYRENVSQNVPSDGVQMDNGTCVLKFTGVSKKRKKACDGAELCINSRPFHSSRYGYKMCVRIYLNGDGPGKGTHMSIFLIPMSGNYDWKLKWPFTHEVTISLIDQSRSRQHNVVQSFLPDPASSSFQQPLTDMNVASGFPQFASLGTLTDERYVVDDTMYIKVKVESPRQFH